MPYKYSSTTRQGKRERKGKSTKSLAAQVRKNTALLKSVEVGSARREMVTVADTTATLREISETVQGDDIANRHGRRIKAFSVSIRGSCVKAAASAGSKMRLLVFRDNYGSTTIPTLSDLFVDEQDFFDNEHKRDDSHTSARFTVMWDKYIILNENFDGQETAKSFKFYKKLSHEIIYTGTAATDEGKGSMWLLQGGTPTTNLTTVTGDIIFKFTDI